MKYMTMKEKYFNLQLFAGEGEDTGGADPTDGGDDQDDDESDEDDGEEDEKKFSQKDVDDAVKKRLARERRKWQREQNKSNKKPDGKEEPGDDGKGKDDTKLKEVQAKDSKLEMKLACFEAGVSKDSVTDVVALARAYMEADEDLDMEDAIEKVVKKYPQFKTSAEQNEDEDEPGKKSWGQRQSGKGAKKLSGVEARFYDINPDLRK